MTLAAALGVIPEAVAGGSAAAWLSGKVIATVAAVIIGGTSIALLTTSGSKPEAAPAPAAQAPAVHVAPAMPEQTAPQPATATAPAASTARSAAPAVSDRPATKAPAVASSQKARETKTTSKLRIPNSGTVQHGPQIGKNK
jgi:hypothetical protein